MLRSFAIVTAVLALASSAMAGELLDAVKVGDVSKAEAALSKGADANEKTGFLTPLAAAILGANYEMTALLLANGADPNKTAGSNVPLFMASGLSDPRFVQLLIQKGADVRFAANGITALHRAAESGCLPCAESLLAAGADVNALTTEATPPAIHLALMAGHNDIAALLMAHGYKPPRRELISRSLKNASVSNGKAVFDKACAKCHRIDQKLLAPPLKDIIGRPKARMDHETYSEAMQAIGGTWEFEELNAFIANPGAAIPGTSMSFIGLPDKNERVDLILYLRSQSANPPPLP